MACSHQGCRCDESPVRIAGRTWCSERCAEQEISTETARGCDCGHADCGAAS